MNRINFFKTVGTCFLLSKVEPKVKEPPRLRGDQSNPITPESLEAWIHQAIDYKIKNQ